MCHHHTLTVLTLSLLSLPLLTSAGGIPLSPDDFNTTCIDPADFPALQQNFAYLDAYDSLSQTNTVILGDWEWNDVGTCNNSLSVNSSNAVTGSTLRVSGFNFNFHGNGRNDPVTIETIFTCTLCPSCVVTLSFISAGNAFEALNFSCGSLENSLVVPQSEAFTEIQYSVVFADTPDVQYVVIESYRIYQFMDCSEITFLLADYGMTDSGIGPVDATGCVANAESSGVARAGCEDGRWVKAPDTKPCNCSAGFEPNSNLTACTACGDGLVKMEVGNNMCEPCEMNFVPNAMATGCVCAEGYTGNLCDHCEANYYYVSDDASCQACPSGSETPAGNQMDTCTCTGNLVTSMGTSSTTTAPCEACGLGYYRASDEDPNQPCLLCAEGYFMLSNGECQECPSGSTRTTDNPQDQCTCTAALVTSTGNTVTSSMDDPCNNCPANQFMRDSNDCSACPASSGRELTDSSDSCTCLQNTAVPLPSGDTTTTTMMADCSSCIDGFSKDPSTTMCTGIVLMFSETEYRVSEAKVARLTIEASPPPARSITVTITTPSSLSASPEQLVLSDSADSGSFGVSGYNDTIALQDPREFEISFGTDNTASITGGTARLVVTDNDVVRAMFEEADYEVDEDGGSVEVCVKLSTETAKDVSVRVVGMSASVGKNSRATVAAPELGELSLVLNFTAAEVRQCENFDVTDDEEAEDDEQYRLTLEVVSPDVPEFTVSDEAAQVFIIDDDDPEESDTSLTIGLIVGVCAGGAILAIILAILCIVCLCCWRFNVKRQGFYTTYEDSTTAPTMLRYSASLRSISSQSIVAAEGKRSTQKENEFFV